MKASTAVTNTARAGWMLRNHFMALYGARDRRQDLRRQTTPHLCLRSAHESFRNGHPCWLEVSKATRLHQRPLAAKETKEHKESAFLSLRSMRSFAAMPLGGGSAAARFRVLDPKD